MNTNILALSDGTKSGSLVVAPQSFGEVMQFADMMAKCTFVPRHLRGQPANCMAVCLQALRWSMDPFSVAQKTYFISDGAAPGYEAQLINAVILSRAPLEGRLKIEWSGDGQALKCTVSGKIRGDPDIKTKTCHMANVTIKNSLLWKSDPEQQLAYFTTRAWARLYCPDIIMGVYSPDELNTTAVGPDQAIDVTPKKSASRLDALEETIASGAVQLEQHAAPDAGGEAPTSQGAPAGTLTANADASRPSHTSAAGGVSHHPAGTLDYVGEEFDLPELDVDHLDSKVRGYAAAKDREGLKRWRAALTPEANKIVSDILAKLK